MLRKIRTITSHAGYARWLAETDDDAIGQIPRQADIPSPYAFASDWPVWRHASDGLTIVREVSHKRYVVYAVPAGMVQELRP